MNNLRKPILFFSFVLSILASFIFIYQLQAAGEARQWGTNGTNITSDAAYQEWHFSVSDGGTGIYVAWDNSSSGGLAVGSQGVYIQRYNSSGTAIWGAPVKVYNNLAELRGLEQDGSGGVVVAVTDGATNTTSVKRLNSSGVVQWTTDAFNTSTSVSDRVYMEKDSSNNFFIVKEDRIQKLDVSGTRAWGLNGVDYNETVLSYSIYPQIITPLENGGVAISWITTAAGDESVYAQYINSAGTPLGSSIVVSGGAGVTEGLSATALADGTNFYVVYAVETGAGTNLYDLKVKKYDTSGTNLFAAGGVTIESGISIPSQSSVGSAGMPAIIHDTADDSITFGARVLKKLYRINTSGTALWSASLENIQFNESTVGNVEPLSLAFSLNKDEIAFTAESGYTTFAPFLITFDYDTGARHSYNEVATIPGASDILRKVPLHVDTSGNYLVSWQYATSGAAPRPYDVFIQKLTPQNYGSFQITGVFTSTQTDVLYYGASIKDGSPYGANDANAPLLVTQDGFRVAAFNTNMTADRNWAGLEAEFDAGADKVFFEGLSSLAGAIGTTYDLYAPSTTKELLIACPSATNPSDVTSGCTGRVVLSNGDPGVTQQSIDGVSYWVLDNVSYTGAIAVDGFNITGLDSGLNVIDVATGDNLESGNYFGNYTVRIVNASNSKVLAELSINMNANHDWSGLTFGSTTSETYLGGVTSLPGVVGSTYSIFVPRGAGDNNVYTCPTAANVGQVTPACSGVSNLGVSATNLSQETISGSDYWEYANYTGTNIGKEYVEVLLGDILIIYNDALTTNNSAQHMYDLLDGLGYDVVLHGSDGVPVLDTLNSYKAVIYSQGDGYGLDSTQVAILKDYMDNGKGRIFLEGEEFQYDAGDTDFSENYMRTTDADQDLGDPGILTVTNPSHPVTDGLPTSSTHTSSSGYSDGLDPINGSEALISGDFGGSPTPVLIAYDNNLTCTDAKKTVTYTAIWQNSTLGIDDSGFRDPLLVNIVDWLIDNPCSIQNLPAGYDLVVSGDSGIVDANLTTSDSLPLADFDINLNDNHDWTGLDIVHNPTTSTVFSGNLTSMPGFVEPYTLYLPIAPALLTLDSVTLCFNATNISEVTADCTSAVVLEEGVPLVYSGQTLEANKQNIGGNDYWEITGLESQVGALVVEPEEEEPTEEPGEDPEEETPTTSTGTNNQNLGASGGEEDTDEETPTSFPVSEEVEPGLGGVGNGGVIDDDNEEPMPTESDEPSEFDNFQTVVENVAPPVIVAAATIAGAALINGTLGNYTAMFLGFIVWRKRKYWGIVYDSGNFSPLAFTTIRAYRLQASGEVFVAQTVSDLNGLYGLNISDAGNYRIEYLRQGFRTINKTITLVRNQDIILDISMVREIESPQGFNLIRYIWKQNASLIMQVVRFIVLSLLGYGTLVTLNIVGSAPIFINILVLVLYVVSFVIQLIVIISPMLNRASGAILDSKTMKPIAGAIVRFFDPEGKILDMENMGITNNAGQVKLRMKSDIYKYNAYASNYSQTEGIIKVNPNGKLSSAIKLEKQEGLSGVKFGT